MVHSVTFLLRDKKLEKKKKKVITRKGELGDKENALCMNVVDRK